MDTRLLSFCMSAPPWDGEGNSGEAGEHDDEGFALVIFDEREPLTQEEESPDKVDARQLHFLQEELNTTRQRLKAIVEEYESTQEEMRSSNEEMQSTNEELRSAIEEMETSKEELQSINEELHTVNQQNRHKMAELDQLSSDLQNVLIATDIATLFLDRNLRILRFTPRLGDLFNIRMTDRGRPISDLTHRLGYEDLVRDAELVQTRLVPMERELQDDGGKCYLTRLHPYRNSQDRIEGVVVSFIDITDRRDAERMRLEVQVTEQKIESEKAMRAKEMELARVARTLMVGELASSIAHEVNQPLSGVVTNAEAGLRWLDGETPDVEEAKNSLALIIRDGNRASSVTRRVREFVKRESNAEAALDIREIIRETLALLRFDLEKNRIAVSLDFSDELPIIHGDRVQLEQVILNLVINAVEAMGSAG